MSGAKQLEWKVMTGKYFCLFTAAGRLLSECMSRINILALMQDVSFSNNNNINGGGLGGSHGRTFYQKISLGLVMAALVITVIATVREIVVMAIVR